jgi:hypothetical protein
VFGSGESYVHCLLLQTTSIKKINERARFMSKKMLDGKQWNHLNITLKTFEFYKPQKISACNFSRVGSVHDSARQWGPAAHSPSLYSAIRMSDRVKTDQPCRYPQSRPEIILLALVVDGGGRSDLGKAMATGFNDGDYGAFMERFDMLPPQSQQQLPLHGLTFAIKDM